MFTLSFFVALLESGIGRAETAEGFLDVMEMTARARSSAGVAPVKPDTPSEWLNS